MKQGVKLAIVGIAGYFIGYYKFKVKTEVTEKLYEKEMHNINTHVESISDIEIDILEVDVNQVTDIELGGYVE